MNDNPNPICDFCSSPTPSWRWRCRSFAVPEARYRSVSDWAACDACNTVILASDWEALADRAVQSYKDAYPIDALVAELAGHLPEIREWVKELHRKFATHRLTTTSEPITNNKG